jgi:hypothetical protein
VKRRILQEPHGVTSQKTPFFIVTVVKTSNLTQTGNFQKASPLHARILSPFMINVPTRATGSVMAKALRYRTDGDGLETQFYQCTKSFRRHSALGFAQPLTEMSTRDKNKNVRFKVFTEVTMKYVVFWDITPCGSYKNRRFGGTQLLHHKCDKNR